jgi:hypothetical protein
MVEADIPARDPLSKETLRPFQSRVAPWMQECFGPVISADTVERNHRFLEEALELVQACACSRNDALRLVDYVYGRPAGEPSQEVGGVMVTLAALCLAQRLNMHSAGETELTRISQPETVEKIRQKQATKPKGSPLLQVQAEEAFYYIQNKGYVGNSLCWWKKGGSGYTCDLNKAWKVTLEEAKAICHGRPKEDFMRPVTKMDALVQHHIDNQDMHVFAVEDDLFNSIENGRAK